MKLTNEIQIEDFLSAVKQSKGGVKLRSRYGDVFELKSQMSRYVAIAALLGEHGDELELFCDNREDERFFLKFFAEHPEVQ